jgi:hypothetical protein
MTTLSFKKPSRERTEQEALKLAVGEKCARRPNVIA